MLDLADMTEHTLRSVGPFERDAVVVGVGGAELERLTADREHHLLLRIQTATRRRYVDALHVRGLERPADA